MKHYEDTLATTYYLSAGDHRAWRRIRERARSRGGMSFTALGARAVLTIYDNYPGEGRIQDVVRCDAATWSIDHDKHEQAVEAWLYARLNNSDRAPS